MVGELYSGCPFCSYRFTRATGQNYEKSLKSGKEDGVPSLELVTLFNSLARMHQEREAYADAQHAMELMVYTYEARGIMRQNPNLGLAKVLGNLGNVAAMQERHKEAVEHLRYEDPSDSVGCMRYGDVGGV